MKTCPICKIEKVEATFSKDTSRNDGLDYCCKACRRERQQSDAYKAYHQTDAYKDSQKAYRQTDAYKASRKASKKAAYLRRKAAAASLLGNK